MRIDRSHRSWLIFSFAVLAGSTAWYAHYILHSMNGPSGGSLPGLVFGSLGMAFMLFAGLLGGRKRVRTWRIGRAEFWMRGHLWLGMLALPMIWLHGGFRHGGLLTSAMMWLFYAIVISGIVGAFLQHFLPKHLTREIPDETIYEQVPQVMVHLQAEAEDVAAICGPSNGETLDQWRQQRTSAIKSRQGRALMTEDRRDQLLAAVATAPAPGSGAMREFYAKDIRPFLAGLQSVLTDEIRADVLFQQRRLASPVELHPPLGDLQRICNEYRQLQRQRKLHHWLHGWLFIHVPLSMALMALSVVHAIIALRY